MQSHTSLWQSEERARCGAAAKVAQASRLWGQRASCPQNQRRDTAGETPAGPTGGTPVPLSARIARKNDFARFHQRLPRAKRRTSAALGPRHPTKQAPTGRTIIPPASHPPHADGTPPPAPLSRPVGAPRLILPRPRAALVHRSALGWYVAAPSVRQYTAPARHCTLSVRFF